MLKTSHKNNNKPNKMYNSPPMIKSNTCNYWIKYTKTIVIKHFHYNPNKKHQISPISNNSSNLITFNSKIPSSSKNSKNKKHNSNKNYIKFMLWSNPNYNIKSNISTCTKCTSLKNSLKSTSKILKRNTSKSIKSPPCIIES